MNVQQAVSKTTNGLLSKGQGLYKRLGFWGAVGTVAAVGTYADERQNGASVPGAIASAAVDQILWDVAGGWGLAYLGVTGAGALGQAGYAAYDSYSRELARTSRPFTNQYADTQSAYTMRQRAVQAIQQSKLNARSALGNEAQYFHR